MRAVAIALLAAGPPRALADDPAIIGAAPATYTGRVGRIFQEHCLSCHRVGSSAARIPLVTYEDARALGATLLSPVESGAMPPWPIDAEHSMPMQNDPRLSPAELQALRAWVAAGEPRGTGPEPASAASAQGWNDPQHRLPDAVVVSPRIAIPARGELPYMRALIKVVTPADRWIGGLQAIPGNAAVVHHMGIAEVQLPPGVGPAQVHDLEETAQKLGTPARSLVDIEPAVIDTRLSNDYDMLAAFTPGEGYEAFPPGTGKLLRAGPTFYINFNIHYTTIGEATSDQSRLGLWFLRSKPERQLFRTPSAGRTIVADGHELFPDDPGSKAEGTDVAIPPVPPYANAFELTGITPYDRAVTLYSLQPHAHLRGKDFLYQLVLPDGRWQTLLSIPHYNYHWQLSYAFATPVEAPAGSKLVVTAHYDNSASNQHIREFSLINPQARCGPDKYAFFRSQNQTWDEMFSPIVQYAVRTGRAGGQPVPTVATQGCLVSGRDGKWTLGTASPAQDTSSPTISRVELAHATATRIGRNAYTLIGSEPFHPTSLEGRRVLIKGMQRPGDRSRINVTAMQPLGDLCE